MKKDKDYTKEYVRLVISDLHLGSEYSQEELLYEMLTTIEFDELILAGDIIEFLRKPKFTDHTYKILDFINSLNKKVIYIVGNHDDAFEKFIGKKIKNIEFMKTYDFHYYSRKYRIEHGDQYETGIIKWRHTMELISFFQNVTERILKIDITTWWSRRQIKKRKLIRIWDIVKWNEDADVYYGSHS